MVMVMYRSNCTNLTVDMPVQTDASITMMYDKRQVLKCAVMCMCCLVYMMVMIRLVVWDASTARHGYENYQVDSSTVASIFTPSQPCGMF